MEVKKFSPYPQTWRAAMPILIIALECGTVEGKAQAKRELMELARELDEANEENEHGL